MSCHFPLKSLVGLTLLFVPMFVLVREVNILHSQDSEFDEFRTQDEALACWMLAAEEHPETKRRRKWRLWFRSLFHDRGRSVLRANTQCATPTARGCQWWGDTVSASCGFANHSDAQVVPDALHKAWIGRVPYYGIDPKTGLSWGASISGAEMVARKSHFFLLGGYDKVTGARPWLLHADMKEVFRTGNLSWDYVNIDVSTEPWGSDCPGAIYGHTMTLLGGREGRSSSDAPLDEPLQYFVLGGINETKTHSSRWGIFKLHAVDEAESTRWVAAWTACGQDHDVQRAWHSASWLGDTNLEADFRGVLICGGTRSISVPAAVTFHPQLSRLTFDHVVTAGYTSLEACQRVGHSSIRIGGSKAGHWIVELGGMYDSDEGGPNSERGDVYMFNIGIMAFLKRDFVPQNCAERLRDGEALSRMHKAVRLGKRAALIVGGAYHGGAGVSMLRWHGFAAAHEKAAAVTDMRGTGTDMFSVAKLETQPLPCNVESAQMPPLSKHSMVELSPTEAIVFGGEIESTGQYSGMLLIRLLP